MYVLCTYYVHIMYTIGRFIPDEFLILVSAFMDRGSVTYKNPVYFFFRQKKNI
jgi:hypothetical protein